MNPPPVTPAELAAIRDELGLSLEAMAGRIGISRSHLADLEHGAPITPVTSNAIRWVQHVKGALPDDICTTCDGIGRLRAPEAPPRSSPRTLCTTCGGEGVQRAGTTSFAQAGDLA